MKMPKEEKMSSSLLDGTEILHNINEKPFIIAKKTGFPFYPEDVEEILGNFFHHVDRMEKRSKKRMAYPIFWR